METRLPATTYQGDGTTSVESVLVSIDIPVDPTGNLLPGWQVWPRRLKGWRHHREEADRRVTPPTHRPIPLARLLSMSRNMTNGRSAMVNLFAMLV